MTCPLENGRGARFYSPWVRTKTCPLLEFSVEGARGPALQAIDEKPRRLRQDLLRSPQPVCLFRLPRCEPKPVRFLNFPSKMRRVRRFRRSAKSRAGCARISCGARNQSAFFRLPGCEPKPVRFLNFPSKVRRARRSRRLTKSRAGCTSFCQHSVSNAVRGCTPAILKQKADRLRVYHVRSSEITAAFSKSVFAYCF
jgi:hypothetical protein